MSCPHCASNKVVKNGHRNGKQSYLRRDCRRQFRDNPQLGYLLIYYLKHRQIPAFT